jgi:hypothetical protein
VVFETIQNQKFNITEQLNLGARVLEVLCAAAPRLWCGYLNQGYLQ